MREAAFAYLNQNPLLYRGMLEPIRRGTAVLLSAQEGGVLLREEKSGAYMLAADTPELGETLVQRIPECGLVAVHQESLVRAVKERFGFETILPCHQAVYTAQKPPRISAELEFRALTEDDLPAVCAQYRLLAEEDIRERVQSGALFGGYRKETLVGFVGEHPEGSIGMLEVLPSYRRRGYGAALEAFQINRMLVQGRVPYAQIIQGNENSLRLHQKLGFELSESLLYWLF